MTRPVVVERRIKARPETIFSYFTDPERWLRWQGVEATVEPRPGGVFRVNVNGGGFASGRFVTVEPPHRIVFTWGWEVEEYGLGRLVPPGASTVEITLADEGDVTLVRLTHRDLPGPAADLHRGGWEHYLGRLVVVASGGDPGPDPELRPPPR
jgi:uncharacterized protein YndB with AHSA1/START domain